ncbi:MAG: LacI family transcriptional regulator [Pelagibaca sp.]|nr:LacI family transcriptional regulator [Pelagibaca sp.]
MAMGADGPRKRATIKDVAQAAGVSPGTVSNALSGKRRVDSATQARITAAIERLGYVPNLAARGMRTGRAGTIAIFSSMPTAVAAGAARLGFLMEIAASAAVAALESNTALLLVPPIEDPVRALSTIAFDGAILVEPETEDPYLSLLAARGVPTMVIGPATEDQPLAVRIDYRRMAETLFDHLHDVGARDILLVVGQSGRASNIAFREVFSQRSTAHGLPGQEIVLPEAEAERGAQAALRAHVAELGAPDAVLVPIDAMATGVMAALRELGLRVPGDVRVATRYDGIRARSESPALTSLDLHLDQVAELAARGLVGALDTGAGAMVVDAPEPDLLVRGSTVLS